MKKLIALSILITLGTVQSAEAFKIKNKTSTPITVHDLGYKNARGQRYVNEGSNSTSRTLEPYETYETKSYTCVTIKQDTFWKDFTDLNENSIIEVTPSNFLMSKLSGNSIKATLTSTQSNRYVAAGFYASAMLGCYLLATKAKVNGNSLYDIVFSNLKSYFSK